MWGLGEQGKRAGGVRRNVGRGSVRSIEGAIEFMKSDAVLIPAVGGANLGASILTAVSAAIRRK
ncbi:hypothetical protein DQG13_06910 [Paenibacillus sp. YN15]|nr:hypothetical protein DQG13_06910 [Paenibacillus sp. YN15]